MLVNFLQFSTHCNDCSIRALNPVVYSYLGKHDNFMHAWFHDLFLKGFYCCILHSYPQPRRFYKANFIEFRTAISEMSMGGQAFKNYVPFFFFGAENITFDFLRIEHLSNLHTELTILGQNCLVNGGAF